MLTEHRGRRDDKTKGKASNSISLLLSTSHGCREYLSFYSDSHVCQRMPVPDAL